MLTNSLKVFKMSDAAANLRQLAGIYLKNTILDLVKTKSLPAVLVQYVQNNIFSVLGDPAREYRRIAAGIISSLLGGSPLVRKLGLSFLDSVREIAA